MTAISRSAEMTVWQKAVKVAFSTLPSVSAFVARNDGAIDVACETFFSDGGKQWQETVYYLLRSKKLMCSRIEVRDIASEQSYIHGYVATIWPPGAVELPEEGR